MYVFNFVRWIRCYYFEMSSFIVRTLPKSIHLSFPSADCLQIDTIKIQAHQPKELFLYGINLQIVHKHPLNVIFVRRCMQIDDFNTHESVKYGESKFNLFRIFQGYIIIRNNRGLWKKSKTVFFCKFIYLELWEIKIELISLGLTMITMLLTHQIPVDTMNSFLLIT